jgi:hypothetical protein
MAIVEGRKKPAQDFYFNYRFGPVKNFADDVEVLEALREAYGDAAEWIDLDRILTAEVRNTEAEEVDTRRYFLNEVASAAEDVFNPDILDPNIVDVETVPLREQITLGFDGARFDDSTAIIATRISDGYQWIAGLWEKPFDAPEDWQVSSDDVTAKMIETFREYRVVRLYADPFYWEAELEHWAAQFGGRKVVHWHTNRERQMAMAVSAYLTALRSNEVRIGNDPEFVRHLRNARRRDTRVRDEDGRTLYTVKKDRPGSPRKIDAAVAAILSWQARLDVMAKAGRGTIHTF